MATVENLWVYPVKGLDPMSVEAADIDDAGSFRGDRTYALLEPDVSATVADRTDSVGKTLNGKEIDTLHELDSRYDPETAVIELSVEGGEEVQFDLETERDAASAWFSEFAGTEVRLRRQRTSSFVDRPELGPSVISTATLAEVASWFEEMTVEGARTRLRPNVEISGVPAFWEDRFLGDDPSGFEIAGTRFEGAEACARCVVPSRDPETGDTIDDFRQEFAARREETFPEWADAEEFAHFFTVMLITRVPESEYGETVRVGDEVTVTE